ncbi:hypothetical protein IMZ48_23635, partial [Candidatus Bathyarchaeota archaeon]|nr:hypothetical protein [Candidatus Bathyarchaeota archaeon]
GTLESSKYISAVSTVRAFVLLAVFPVINYVFRTRPAARRRRARGSGPVVEKNRGADALDLWVIRVALVSDVLGATGYLVARSPALFVAGGMVTAIGGLGSATIQASITKHVPPDMVGQLLGAVGLLHALSRVLSPLAFSGVYYATLETFPHAIFVLLVGLFALSLLASLVVRPHGELSPGPGLFGGLESSAGPGLSGGLGMSPGPEMSRGTVGRVLKDRSLTMIMQSTSPTMRARRRVRGRRGDRPSRPRHTPGGPWKRSGCCEGRAPFVLGDLARVRVVTGAVTRYCDVAAPLFLFPWPTGCDVVDGPLGQRGAFGHLRISEGGAARPHIIRPI